MAAQATHGLPNLKKFCDPSSACQHRGREYLVLEFFPEADFFNPPAPISSPNAADRLDLSQRASLALPANALYLLTKDKEIYRGLLKLWSTTMTRMPAQV
ncbi:hypothetical protein LTR35_018339 [Friedmanniomyces endolithicus]|nr:hypothetical protein LTR35_018339 [Friedmanniomyces endolithicus]KAK0961811.1 hypothetical protein LTR54_018445 [Friedmanniomyces endolithicus]